MLKATEEEIEEVREYFEWQAPDLEVDFMQKVYSDAVENTRHDGALRGFGPLLAEGARFHHTSPAYVVIAAAGSGVIFDKLRSGTCRPSGIPVASITRFAFPRRSKICGRTRRGHNGWSGQGYRFLLSVNCSTMAGCDVSNTRLARTSDATTDWTSSTDRMAFWSATRRLA